MTELELVRKRLLRLLLYRYIQLIMTLSPGWTMSKFESIAISFHIDADGRRYLTEQQLADNPHLQDFINRFRNCFEHDAMSDRWIFIESPR